MSRCHLKDFFDYFRVDFLFALDSFKAVLTQQALEGLKRSKLDGVWIIGQKSTFSINIILCILGIDVDILMGPK